MDNIHSATVSTLNQNEVFFGYHASGHTLLLTLVYCSHSMVSYDTLSMLYLCTRTDYRFAETSV